ncbi:MAG: DUF2156 domain-containing protein, partial [Candidatus Omnitrophica bacterium]|nr:DUF2156 domain-containing protein [Candidatus Omnitrophota bacterium]
MVFKELQLSDQGIFEQLLSSNGYSLSSYHFGNIFVWKGLFRIVYAVIKGRICLFFQDKHTCFMYLPPLGGEPDISILEACFTIMDKFNLNKNISRIENVQKDSLCFYRRLGYDTRLKSPDYLYLREDISALRGNKLKSKRASYNYFNKKYDFELRPFCKEDAPGCLLLHKQWVSRRRQKVDDPAYRWMLGDSFSSHKLAMDNFRKLGLIGYVLKSKKEVIGYTFGFK